MIPTLAMLQGPPAFRLWDIIKDAGPISLATLLALAGLSVAAWAIWGSRRFTLARMIRQAREAREAFLQAADTEAFAAQCRVLPAGPIPRMFTAAHDEYRELVRSWTGDGRPPDGVRAEAARELLTRTLHGARMRELAASRIGLSVLATIGSTSPFIGLFGTVWGVVKSFQGIGAAKSAELAVVAPGIAEALVATAAGLIAAVPAVWFYNGLANQVRRLSAELDSFTVDFLNVYDRAVASGARQPER